MRPVEQGEKSGPRPSFGDRLAWVIPPGVMALPTAFDGLWWIADLAQEEFNRDAVGLETVMRWARERGQGTEVAVPVECASYPTNPWPMLDTAGRRDDAWIPKWFDMRPIRTHRMIGGMPHKREREERR